MAPPGEPLQAKGSALARIDWATQSQSELAQWTTRRHYQAILEASGGATHQLNYRTQCVSDGMVSISRSSGTGRFNVRRNWDHVRRSSGNMFSIYFPLGGEIRFAQNGLGAAARSDEFFILREDRPLLLSSVGDDFRPWEALIVTVPAHLLQNVLPAADRGCGRKFALRPAAELGRAFFLGILEKKQVLGDEELWRLTKCGLDILSTDVKEGLVPEAVHVDIVGMHLGRVQRSIHQHLSQPGLSVDHIAAKCGISRRYVHQLMREGGITFSRYLWEARLTQADAWIRSLDCRFMRLESIAAQAGFRSASHFSRMYRRRYGCSPREAREAALGRR